MKKKRILQAVILTVLFLLAVILGIIVFLPTPTTVEPRSTGEIEIVTFELVPTPSPTPPLLLPSPMAEAEATEKPSPKREGEILFTLKIHGETISIAPNVEEDTLEETPGWLTTSAMPGESGMCVIYGHRNRDHLKVLKHVEIGDPITAILRDGTEHTYTVTDIQIHESTDTLRLPTIDGDSIVLVTCYPFRYTGHAPGKYVVVGKSM